MHFLRIDFDQPSQDNERSQIPHLRIQKSIDSIGFRLRNHLVNKFRNFPWENPKDNGRCEFSRLVEEFLNPTLNWRSGMPPACRAPRRPPETFLCRVAARGQKPPLRRAPVKEHARRGGGGSMPALPPGGARPRREARLPLSVVIGGVRTGAVVRGAVRVRAVVRARVRVVHKGTK